jgi:hypothetical protein
MFLAAIVAICAAVGGVASSAAPASAAPASAAPASAAPASATPAAAAPDGCVYGSYVIKHRTDPNRRLKINQRTCVYTNMSGSGHYGTVHLEPANGSSDNFVKATLRVELHSCSGRGLSARTGTFDGSFGYLEVDTSEVRKDAFPRVYAQARVSSTFAISYGNQWAGGGMFQSTASLTC